MEEYRAKITNIYPIVEDIYNTNDETIVRDDSDIYILLDNEREACVLEQLNACEKELKTLTKKLYEIIDENIRNCLGG